MFLCFIDTAHGHLDISHSDCDYSLFFAGKMTQLNIPFDDFLNTVQPKVFTCNISEGVDMYKHVMPPLF